MAVLDRAEDALAGKSTLNRLKHAGKIGLDRHHTLDHDPSPIDRGIEAQRVVVDQVLVAEYLGEDALAKEIGEAALYAVGLAAIREVGREPVAELKRPVGGRQQHRAPVRRDRAAVESAQKFGPA